MLQRAILRGSARLPTQIFRQTTRRYAAGPTAGAHAAEENIERREVLRKGAKRDPELYVRERQNDDYFSIAAPKQERRPNAFA